MRRDRWVCVGDTAPANPEGDDDSAVAAAVAAVDDLTPYPDANIERVKAGIDESFEGFCAGCGYCLPCPAGVELPKVMDTSNQRIREGTGTAMRDRLKWHWALPASAAAACTECGACEDACPQLLLIREPLKAIAAPA